MIRLAIETATPFGSVAVGRDEHVLAEVGLGEQTGHADAMVPALDAVLALAGLDRGDIGEVVVGAGPGSFTGVRVAGATAKGLVATLDVPLVAYSSLLALAAGVPSDRPVCALFDARRGEVYAGCWRVSADGIQVLLEPVVGPVAEAVSRVGHPVLFVGDGAVRYRDVLVGLAARGDARGDAAGADGGGVATGAAAHPRAATLLWLAAHHPAAGRVADARAWEPLYVRGSSAERGVAG